MVCVSCVCERGRECLCICVCVRACVYDGETMGKSLLKKMVLARDFNSIVAISVCGLKLLVYMTLSY
jgi:hypothetical protein